MPRRAAEYAIGVAQIIELRTNMLASSGHHFFVAGAAVVEVVVADAMGRCRRDENRPNEMVRAMARVSLALSAQGR